jgi:hypothetical protein
MKNPFAPQPKDESAIPTETMQRWQTMQTHLGDRTDLSRLQPVVAKIVGEKIENQWHQWARTSGQVFPEKFKDSSGRQCTRYLGDIKAAFAPWNQPTIKVKLAETTHFQGRTYIKGQEPASVRRSMALMKAGFSE